VALQIICKESSQGKTAVLSWNGLESGVGQCHQNSVGVNKRRVCTPNTTPAEIPTSKLEIHAWRIPEFLLKPVAMEPTV